MFEMVEQFQAHVSQHLVWESILERTSETEIEFWYHWWAYFVNMCFPHHVGIEILVDIHTLSTNLWKAMNHLTV